jgi:hypothetical protein
MADYMPGCRPPQRHDLARPVLAGIAAASGTILWALAAHVTVREFPSPAVLLGLAAGLAVARTRDAPLRHLQAAAALALAGSALGTLTGTIANLHGHYGTGRDIAFAPVNIVLRDLFQAAGSRGLLFWMMAAATAACAPRRWRQGAACIAQPAPGTWQPRAAVPGYGQPLAREIASGVPGRPASRRG